MTSTQTQGRQQPPLWRNVRVLRIGGQALFVVVVAAIATWLYLNLTANLAELGLGTSFSFLQEPAGFEIARSDFQTGESMWAAILVGVGNTLRVGLAGIVLASVLGLLVGIGRLSKNWLVRKVTTVYVELFRNIPVLIIIMFCYFAVLLEFLPSEPVKWLGVMEVSIREVVVPWISYQGGHQATFAVVVAIGALAAIGVGIWRTRRSHLTGKPHHRIFWALVVLLASVVLAQFVSGRPLDPQLPATEPDGTQLGLALSPEFAALLIGLTLYTASHIAEIVRASVQAVPRGQGEAAGALALSSSQQMRLVVLPQALRIMVPPLANQYLNLVKNSSLAIVVAFPELTRIISILIGSRAPAPQSTLVQMGFYLAISLTIALATNLVNRRLAMRGGRR